jgi:glycosyltransferase involved in cell wall biosynthesis
MRILIASCTYAPQGNGQARFTTNLARGLAARGHSVTVICPSDRQRASTQIMDGVTVHKLRSIPLLIHPQGNLELLGRLYAEELIQRFRPEVIHTQDHYFLARDVVAVAKQQGIPTIGTCHFMPENVLHYLKVPTALNKRAVRVAWWTVVKFLDQLDAATAPTETAVRILREQGARVRLTAVSNGIDLTRFRPASRRENLRERLGLDSHARTLLFVGRIDREKHLDLLIKALAQMRDLPVQLALAGKGADHRRLSKMVEELELEDRVHFLGYVPDADLPALYNLADVFLMASEAELQSIATMEAMASGLPVIGADANALPELIRHGVNGFLFPPRDSNTLGHYLRALVADANLARRMGENSLILIQKHDLRNSIRRYEDLYNEVLQTAWQITPRPLADDRVSIPWAS